MADWDLRDTLSHSQVAFVATINGAICFIFLALWKTPVLTPFQTYYGFPCSFMRLAMPRHVSLHVVRGVEIQEFVDAILIMIRSAVWCERVEGMEVNVDEGGVTVHAHEIASNGSSYLLAHPGNGQVKWGLLDKLLKLHKGFSQMDTDLGSSFWGMVLIVAPKNGLTLTAALVVVLVVAKNVSLSSSW